MVEEKLSTSMVGFFLSCRAELWGNVVRGSGGGERGEVGMGFIKRLCREIVWIGGQIDTLFQICGSHDWG